MFNGVFSQSHQKAQNEKDITKKNVPQIIIGATREWPALKKWSPQFFLSNYKDLIIPVRNFDQSTKSTPYTVIEMNLADYFNYWEGISFDSPKQNLYFADWLFEKHCPELLNDFSLPSYLGRDIIQLLPKSFQYDRQWIFVGHPFANTPIHVDTLGTSAWLTMIQGKKRIRMISPEYKNEFNEITDLYNNETVAYCQRNEIPIYDITITPGDLLYIPAGFLHHVINLTPNILLTGNFVDLSGKDIFFGALVEEFSKPLKVLAKVRQDVEAQLNV